MRLGSAYAIVRLCFLPGLLLGVVACDTQVPQVITGTLSLSEGPVANRTIRLYASYPLCQEAFVETRTDASGAFRFQTQSTKGGLSVVTQSIALCIERSGSWTPIWATILGGGAHRIDLTCKPVVGDEPFAEFCEVKARYDNDA